MSKKNLSDIAAATSSKALRTARSKAEIEMVSAIGGQVNAALTTVCNAAVESRRIDFEGLESKDKAAVLMSEGTTLVALVQSQNEAVASMWESMAPMAAAFLGQMAQTEATRAEASLVSAQADLLNAETREREVEVKADNSATERLKAETARDTARDTAQEAREARYNGKVTGI